MSEGIRWSDVCQRVDSCALTGAAAFAGGIAGAKILINGPMWCYFYALRNLEHSVHDIAQRLQNSQPDGNAIVYGTEKYLTQAVERMLKDGGAAELLFVENSCSVSLIGDDTDGILRGLELDCPFVSMDCGGLLGGFAEGWSRACVQALAKLSGGRTDTYKQEQERPRVNLLGVTDFYFNGRADRQELCRLLELAGYEINCVCGACTVAELRAVAQADLNIVCHEELGLAAARYLEKRYAMPYICAGLPYGCEGTISWLQRLDKVLPCAGMERAEAEAAAMRRYITVWNNEMNCLWGEIWFDKALVSAPGTAAQCLAQALRCEWANLGGLQVLCQHKLQESYCDCADVILTAGEDSYALNELCRPAAGEGNLLLGSSSEAMELRRAGCSNYISSNIAYPVSDEVLLTETPFMGLKGSAYMQQRLWDAYIRQALAMGGRGKQDA